MKGKQAFLAIPIELIDVPDSAARKSRDRYELDMLKRSIAASGLLEPITVSRQLCGRYNLVSGRRRLEACSELGYCKIDCFVVADSPVRLMLRALIDSVQQRQLNMFEQAEAIADFQAKTKISSPKLAEALGISELELSEQLRLLDLDKKHRDILLSAGAGRKEALKIIALPRLQRSQAVKYTVSAEKGSTRVGIRSYRPDTAKVGDIRLFLNSIKRIVESMQSAGYPSNVIKKETKNYYEYTIRISKSPQMLLPGIKGN